MERHMWYDRKNGKIKKRLVEVEVHPSVDPVDQMVLMNWLSDSLTVYWSGAAC